MPRESHGQRSLAATVHGVAELDTTESLILFSPHCCWSDPAEHYHLNVSDTVHSSICCPLSTHGCVPGGSRRVSPCSLSVPVAGCGVGRAPRSPVSPACTLGLTWAAFHGAASRGQHGPVTGLCELSPGPGMRQGWGLHREPRPTRPQVKGTEYAGTPLIRSCARAPISCRAPPPIPTLRRRPPRARGRKVDLKPRAPAATTALSPRFSSHPTTCPPWAPVPSHTSAGVVRETSAAVYLEKRVWGRLGHGG